jgi:hypothetical protein
MAERTMRQRIGEGDELEENSKEAEAVEVHQSACSC